MSLAPGTQPAPLRVCNSGKTGPKSAWARFLCVACSSTKDDIHEKLECRPGAALPDAHGKVSPDAGQVVFSNDSSSSSTEAAAAATVTANVACIESCHDMGPLKDELPDLLLDTCDDKQSSEQLDMDRLTLPPRPSYRGLSTCPACMTTPMGPLTPTNDLNDSKEHSYPCRTLSSNCQQQLQQGEALRQAAWLTQAESSSTYAQHGPPNIPFKAHRSKSTNNAVKRHDGPTMASSQFLIRSSLSQRRTGSRTSFDSLGGDRALEATYLEGAGEDWATALPRLSQASSRKAGVTFAPTLQAPAIEAAHKVQLMLRCSSFTTTGKSFTLRNNASLSPCGPSSPQFASPQRGRSVSSVQALMQERGPGSPGAQMSQSAHLCSNASFRSQSSSCSASELGSISPAGTSGLVRARRGRSGFGFCDTSPAVLTPLNEEAPEASDAAPCSMQQPTADAGASSDTHRPSPHFQAQHACDGACQMHRHSPGGCSAPASSADDTASNILEARPQQQDGSLPAAAAVPQTNKAPMMVKQHRPPASSAPIGPSGERVQQEAMAVTGTPPGACLGTTRSASGTRCDDAAAHASACSSSAGVPPAPALDASQARPGAGLALRQRAESLPPCLKVVVPVNLGSIDFHLTASSPHLPSGYAAAASSYSGRSSAQQDALSPLIRLARMSEASNGMQAGQERSPGYPYRGDENSHERSSERGRLMSGSQALLQARADIQAMRQPYERQKVDRVQGNSRRVRSHQADAAAQPAPGIARPL